MAYYSYVGASGPQPNSISDNAGDPRDTRTVVQNGYKIFNAGPDELRITLDDLTYRNILPESDVGYPVKAGKEISFQHTGMVFLRWPTASPTNQQRADYLITA